MSEVVLQMQRELDSAHREIGYLKRQVEGDALGVVCPFCLQDDFDLIGLKNHFLKHCEAYQDCMTVAEERLQTTKQEPDDD